MANEHAEAISPDHAHEHPTWHQYKWVAFILTVITILEVWIYYLPTLVHSKFFIPLLLSLSAIKFAIVVMFYMHLKYDHRLFRALFTGPLSIAIVTLVALLFLLARFASSMG